MSFYSEGQVDETHGATLLNVKNSRNWWTQCGMMFRHVTLSCICNLVWRYYHFAIVQYSGCLMWTVLLKQLILWLSIFSWLCHGAGFHAWIHTWIRCVCNKVILLDLKQYTLFIGGSNVMVTDFKIDSYNSILNFNLYHVLHIILNDI